MRTEQIELTCVPSASLNFTVARRLAVADANVACKHENSNVQSADVLYTLWIVCILWRLSLKHHLMHAHGRTCSFEALHKPTYSCVRERDTLPRILL